MLAVVYLVTMLQTEEAEAEECQQIVMQHIIAHAMCQRKLRLPGMLIYIGIEHLPVGLLLQSAIIGDTIEVRLIGRAGIHLLASLLQFLMTGRSQIRAMPVQWFIYHHDTAVQLGADGKTPIVHDVRQPVFTCLDKLPAEQHGMSGKSAEEQRLQAVLRIHKMRMLSVGTTQMVEKQMS